MQRIGRTIGIFKRPYFYYQPKKYHGTTNNKSKDLNEKITEEKKEVTNSKKQDKNILHGCNFYSTGDDPIAQDDSYYPSWLFKLIDSSGKCIEDHQKRLIIFDRKNYIPDRDKYFYDS